MRSPAYRIIATALTFATGAFPLFAQAQMSTDYTGAAANPQSCDKLFGLPTDTMTTAASQKYLNPSVCSAYQYLIARYTNPGTCSRTGFTNAQVQGITSLNPTFAINLEHLLQGAQQAGYTIAINSAFRSAAGEACANPKAAARGFQSMHSKGLAADLNFPDATGNSVHTCESGSGSASYQWIAKNAKAYNLGLYSQLHSFVSGECNHVEEVGGTANGGIGPGGGSGTGIQPVTPPASTPASSPTGGSDSEPEGDYDSQQIPQNYCIASTNPILYVPCASAPSQCPAGYAQYNNSCYPLSGQPAVSQPQQSPAVSTPATTASAPATAAATAPTGVTSSSGSLLTTPTSNATPISSLLTAPTLTTSLADNSAVPANNQPQPTTTSITDLLSGVSTQSVAVSTSSPLSLNQSIGNVASLQPNSFPAAASTTASSSISTDIKSLQPGLDGTTFTSNDLSQSPAAPAASGGPGFGANAGSILENLRAQLLGALSYLKGLIGR